MTTVSRSWNDVAVIMREGDGYYNSTAMCRSCGTKLVADYLRLQRTVSYLQALQKALGAAHAQPLVIVPDSGRHDGTWVHPRVAIDLARWLCPDFAVWMDGWFVEEVARRHRPPTPSGPDAELSVARRLYANQISLLTEMDLHYRVVTYMRRFHPRAVVAAGLGELQDSEAKRIEAWRKGYFKGQPDLMILNGSKNSAGLAIELKSPADQAPRASQNQEQAFIRLGGIGWNCLLSNDYDLICRAIDAHMAAETFRCACCSATFSSLKAVEAHALRKRLREVDDEA